MASEEPTNANPTQRAVDFWQSLSGSVKIAIVLVAAGVIIALAVGASALQMPSQHAMVPLLKGHDFSLESRESAIKAFNEANLNNFSMMGSKILVPHDKEAEYLAALAGSKTGLPGNTDDAIDRYIEEQRSWWASTAESERLFRVAEERRVARVIETFPEIDHASVLVSDPPERGTLRTRAGQGTAAVKVSTIDRKPLHPRRIEQIKQLVAGKFRDISGPEKVEVMSDSLSGSIGSSDGTGGPDPSLLSEGSSQYLMTKAAFAMQIENKIRELFADLKGLIVTVNAELDPRFGRNQRINEKEKGPVKRETSDTSSTETANPPITAGGEPGTRTNVDPPGTMPNQGAHAAITSVPPNTQSDESSQKEFDNAQTLTDQSFVDFEPIKVGVVVRYRQGAAAEGEQKQASDGPSPIQIREMIASLGYPGVSVDNVAVQPYVGSEPEVIKTPEPSLVEVGMRHLPSIGLALLGLTAIIVALIVARRGTVPAFSRAAEQTAETPDAAAAPEEELEHRDESVIKFQRIQEQVNKLVKESPEATAALIRRWVLDEL